MHRELLITVFFAYIYLVFAKNNNIKSLTESMGQEVIEIGTPLKDLPPGLEEEPSAENEDETTSTTIGVATKKNIKKVTVETRRKMKDVDKIDGVKQDEEETRIEKELAEIYKDNSDYKSDNVEVKIETAATTTVTIDDSDKPIARRVERFKFQPDVKNRKEVERFRTSVDEISCDRSATEKLDIKIEEDNKPGSAYLQTASVALLSTISGLMLNIL